jgi:hypothetical protein
MFDGLVLCAGYCISRVNIRNSLCFAPKTVFVIYTGWFRSRITLGVPVEKDGTWDEFAVCVRQYLLPFRRDLNKI